MINLSRKLGLARPPQPQVVGFAGYVPEPCVVHPEQVVTYPFSGLLPEDLAEQVDELDSPAYQYDLSIPPGWRVGGFASWHVTDPVPMDCPACSTPMELLLTIDSSEWDGNRSWTPVEERDLPKHLASPTPTEVTVGRWGELNIFSCPADPRHPHRRSIQ